MSQPRVDRTQPLPAGTRPIGESPQPSPPPVSSSKDPVTDRFAGKLDKKYFGLVELAERTKSASTMWWGGRPLSEARNAHRSNTREQFEEAMKGGYNFLEGDVRAEINHPDRLEMRHDMAHESGDNLTLREWLELGRASGRGLKLDFKETKLMPKALDEIERSGVPHERLMFNLSYDGMARWGTEIRRRFPDAILAFNPPDGGKVDASDARKMVAQAEELGKPASFVVRQDLLTDEAIAEFKGKGAISVWNSPFEAARVEDLATLAEKLRKRGVDGVIDLRESAGTWERIKTYADGAKNYALTFADKAKNGLVDGAKKLFSGW
jgi:hypothetical protein